MEIIIPLIVKILYLWNNPCIASKLQGYKFLDNNSSKMLLPGQGTATREYPGVEFPFYLSFCFKFKPDYDRYDQISVMEISTQDSEESIISDIRFVVKEEKFSSHLHLVCD